VSSKPIKSPATFEVCDNTLIAARVKVFPDVGDRQVISLGGVRLLASLQQWRDVNDAVELGFSNLTHREVPARTGSPKDAA
jgi:hypothetical protein